MESLKNSPAIHSTLFLNASSSSQMGLQSPIFFPCSRRKITHFVIRADQTTSSHHGCVRRRPVLAGLGALMTSLFSTRFAFAEEIPESYRAFVDVSDGYSYYYPSDWRDFDFRGHDSAFKDRILQLQNVRVSFKPTNKADIHDLGPMEEVISNLVNNIYAAPSQRTTIFDMQERTIDGKNYWTFEYELASSSFARSAFATIAIGNGRYYTLIVGANERRWNRLRNKLKVVADSFRILDI
ncbi:psbP-like protein 2 [Tasmannia lanceolata]|uniref:psbP-like protein 2 n=1 Tax=Tasmannia lanceolata TaxID=3420 RepID=UPI004063C5AE